MAEKWHGVFPAACTQFKTDQSLDIASTLKHLDAMIDAGIHGLVLLGTVGENCSLDRSEKLALLERAVEHVRGRVPVLTGVAEYTTSQGISFVQEAGKCGVDGLMVLPPMVYKTDQREAIRHFKAIASATSLPIMLYNNPISYGVDVLPAAFRELSSVENVVAIKESSENPRRITDIYNSVGDRFILFCGVDDLAMESYILGAKGWVSGLVNAFPAENRLLWDLMEAGDFARAREVYAWYTPLLHLDTHPKLVQYIKLAAAECGYGTETTRAPRLSLEGVERDGILRIISRAKATRPRR